MIITKKEAQKRGIAIFFPKICQFHQVNPDQTEEYSCRKGCIIIQDPCGCDWDAMCEDCTLNKEEFLRDFAPVVSPADQGTLGSATGKDSVRSVKVC